MPLYTLMKKAQRLAELFLFKSYAVPAVYRADTSASDKPFEKIKAPRLPRRTQGIVLRKLKVAGRWNDWVKIDQAKAQHPVEQRPENKHLNYNTHWVNRHSLKSTRHPQTNKHHVPTTNSHAYDNKGLSLPYYDRLQHVQEAHPP